MRRCISDVKVEVCIAAEAEVSWRGGGLGSSTIFKKFNETYAPS